jgi:ribosomal protein S18 acetylase RimI-like enzyme
MVETLTEVSAPSLVAGVEANYIAFTANLTQIPGAELHRESDVMWYALGKDEHPKFNGVLHTSFSPESADARIDEILGAFGALGVPMLWSVGPSSEPAGIGERLEARGLRHVMNASGMAADLFSLVDHASGLPGLRIDRVQNIDMLRMWLRPFAAAFCYPEDVAEAWFDLFASLGLGERQPLQHYVGTLRAVPVAASSLFLGAGVAGIYQVATIPEVRRQGIGEAMTLAPLCDARNMGYQVGVLTSNDTAAHLYQKLGFETVCHIGFYVAPGSAQPDTCT